MKTTRHMLPAICITGFIMIIFLMFYRGIYEYAEDKCWQELHEVTEQLIREVTAGFEDDIVKLHMLEDILKNNGIQNAEQIGDLYFDTILSTTMFSRIDIWYPDNTMLSKGKRREALVDVSFEDIAAKDEHMTSRITDPQTGNETIYYVLPIEENDNTLAILIGAIDLSDISESFRPAIYQGKGNIGVVDSKDGNFIIDSWHDELGNAYEMESRKKEKGYEDVDLAQKLKNLETGVIVFESYTTGEPLYMYFTPVGIFDWQFVVFAQEDAIFGYLIHLRRAVVFDGMIIVLLLIIYFAWTIKNVRLLRQKVTEVEEQKELLKVISCTDALTLIGNRMKYMEICNDLEGKDLEKIGVIYLDLNGLKQINDQQSHEQGDRYIRKAAEIISELFGEDCYRIGGDEFVVLSVGIAHDEFKSKVAKIKKLMKKSNVSVSMGYDWEEQCTDLEEMHMKAEKWMYKEKELHYLTHDRRR